MPGSHGEFLLQVSDAGLAVLVTFVTQSLASGFCACAPSTQKYQGLVSLLWCPVTMGHQPLSPQLSSQVLLHCSQEGHF